MREMSIHEVVENASYLRDTLLMRVVSSKVIVL